MLMSYLGLGGQHGDVFLANGGKPTIESYGLSPVKSLPTNSCNAFLPHI